MWYIIVHSILSKTLLRYLVTKGISSISRYTFTDLARSKNPRSICCRNYGRNIIALVLKLYICVCVKYDIIIDTDVDFIYLLFKRYFFICATQRATTIFQGSRAIRFGHSFRCAQKIAVLRVFRF